MILVTGASGITGLTLLRHLARRGAATRAFVRSAAGCERVLAAGAGDVHLGSLERDGDVRTAVQGVRAVYHVCPNVHHAEIAIGKRVIDAACAAGVEHVVFHSVIQPQIRAMPHHWDKLEVEGHLVGAGLDYTILQPGVYMQNLRWQWADVVAHGRWSQPFSAASRLATVDLEDVAEAATRVLLEPGWRNATFELIGTPAMTRDAFADVIATVLGRPVRATEEPLDAWEARTLPQLGSFATARLRAMFAWYDAHGLTAANTQVLALLLRRTPTSFEGYVRRLAAGG